MHPVHIARNSPKAADQIDEPGHSSAIGMGIGKLSHRCSSEHFSRELMTPLCTLQKQNVRIYMKSLLFMVSLSKWRSWDSYSNYFTLAQVLLVGDIRTTTSDYE